MINEPLTPTNFCLPDLHEKGVPLVFPGFTRGERWNGWLVPYFDRATAQRLAAALGGHVMHNNPNVFVTPTGRNGTWEDWPAIPTGDRNHWSIGGYAWCWETAEPASAAPPAAPATTATPRRAVCPVDIPEDAWEETGDFDDTSPAWSRLSLHRELLINGCYFHMEAIAVTPLPSEDDLRHEMNGQVYEAVNSSLEPELDRIAGLLGAEPQTQIIRGHEYVVYAIPYAR